eukprot:CAMPEP_0118718842 /NCGR_PEP_ID=MMETSP0800-20121206/29044_1 /TAXON_ID=210618 ORGANISM="Striatella unipunctata, Strain CCMP2910" /NCGR_SAMPLE_ID=MMETSP0800 /ASSEMBLY_ACC=CAM_ASM_000638 /LENGTH=351 /DNA_ID=CAMNT_0006625945 /DNA_START=29 /DNA_END=1082 /DNA_ORIENTATION=+
MAMRTINVPTLLSLFTLLITSNIPFASCTPNIIVMQPDDFSFYDDWTPPPLLDDSNLLRTLPGGLPFIEKLRAEGLHMTQAYAASPVVEPPVIPPSLEGIPQEPQALDSPDPKRPSNLPKLLIDTVSDGNDCSENNIAAVLKEHGYRTGMVGKWHLTNFDDHGGYTYAKSQEVVRSCGFEYAEAIYAENLEGDWMTTEGVTFSHNMEYVVKKAIDFIADNDSRPFFLYFNPTVPHSSGTVDDALDISCGNTPEGILPESDFSDIPEMTRNFGGSCAAYRADIRSRAKSRTINRILGSIWVDDAVGAIYKTLEETGQLRDTIILWQLDHGIEAKGTLFEGGIRIPQFIHYPA